MSARNAPDDLVVAGADDGDMLTAATALEGMGGGFVAVDRGWVRAACPLPVAGTMSDALWEAVVADSKHSMPPSPTSVAHSRSSCR